ncbi:uncharacterized protein B0T23DRAFT_395854 [Neurospora hispaniola]|uniref:Uncharacterized protein n=1 Tax=Neurospora hispaniola TaxID=588809 RepID=A0AAJ0MRC1_9PEZI|nr:hypothetical protein B0T23DRAFT_395854 [Neurospora hispaniola]
MWLSTGIATIGLAFYSPSKKGNASSDASLKSYFWQDRYETLILNFRRKRGPGTYQTSSFPSDNQKCDPASITTSQKGLLCENAKTRAVDVVADTGLTTYAEYGFSPNIQTDFQDLHYVGAGQTRTITRPTRAAPEDPLTSFMGPSNPGSGKPPGAMSNRTS